jgi:hypothetical protein
MSESNETIRLPITPVDAVEELRAGRPLIGKFIEILDLEKAGMGAADPIRVSNCSIQLLTAGNTLERHFALESSVIDELELAGWYFIRGMTISNCTFIREARILFGGHNKDGPFLIQDSTFCDFVDFTDCLFMGPVVLKNVQFQKGTNLLGMEGQPYRVSFDVAPILKNVTGELRSNRWFGGK